MSHRQRIRHALFVFLIAGCSDAAPRMTNAVASAGMGAPPAAAGISGGTIAGVAGSMQAKTPPTMDDDMPTFTNIYTFDFRSCRVETCHGGGLAGLNMSSQDYAWNSLVNQPANPDRLCAMLGKQRVVPSDPDNSLLYLKLDINAPCGQQMPPGGQLARKARERIRTWIALGAKND
jgi:hypothetical protein